MTETLAVCPFCGGEAKAIYIMRAWSVTCECGAGIDEFDTEDEAIAAWNTRTPSPAEPVAQDAVERVARALLAERVASTDETWARYRKPDSWRLFVKDAEIAVAALADREAPAAMVEGES